MMEERAKRVKLLIMDVDGVLTDGRIVYANSGDELKFFDVTDGMGLSMFSRAGLKTAQDMIRVVFPSLVDIFFFKEVGYQGKAFFISMLVCGPVQSTEPQTSMI